MSYKPMPTILCVDDEPTQLTLLNFAFKRAGFTVVQAQDGQEAINQAMVCKPNIILMDLMMPVKDGATATIEMKANPALMAIPIVLFTAYEKGTLAESAVTAGALEIIRKTTPPSELIKKIKAILEQYAV